MKQTSILLLSSALLTGVAFAGSAKEVIPPPPPPEPAPEWNWFAGVSAGYLMDFEEPMYHGHLGVEFNPRSEWTHALFIEVGWTEGDETTTFPTFDGAQRTGTGIATSELEVVPVTLNYKLERRFNDDFFAYFGAGVGVAFLDSSATATFPSGATPRSSASDEVFAAQLFAGLGYNVTPNFEIYGGARWIYLDDSGAPAIGGVAGRQGLGTLEDDVLVELGMRYNF